MKNKIIVLAVAVINSLLLNAQNSISGRIKDQNNKPAQDATITLRTLPDSVLQRGTVSNENGEFELNNVQKGSYVIHISFVGYDDYTANIFVDTAKISLNDIVLYPVNSMLRQVVVSARKPLIVKKSGKTIINIENSIYSTGENSYRLFNIIPGIQSDESGNINFRGQGNVKVYIDNRKMQLSGRQVMDYLKSIPSESIKSFEVSTVPGAEFDAENAGIIVNITLKDSYKYGLTGTLFSNYEQTRYPGFSNGFLLNYRIGKFNFQTNYSFIFAKGFSDNIEQQQFKNKPLFFGQDEKGRERVKLHSPKVGIDYNISDKQIIGANYEITYWDGNTNGTANTNVKKNATTSIIDSMFFTTNQKKMALTNQLVNVFYRNKLDSAGSKLDIGYDFVGYNNKITSNINSTFFLPDFTPTRPSESIQINNPLKIKVNTFNADIDKIFRKGYQWKIGSKFQHSVTDNNIIYYTGVAPDTKLDVNRTNNFEYKERILAFYSSLGKDWGKWSLNAGIRAEYTDYFGKSITTGVTISNNRLDFFPTIFLQRKFNPKNVLSFSYGRRISRPSYQVLNPFEDVEDPYFVNKGNPSLLPYFSNNIELSYLLASKYSFTVSYNTVKGAINNVYKTTGNNNIIISTFGNVNDQENYGASLSIPISIAKWWQVNSYAYVGYTSVTLNERGGQVRSKVHSYFQVNNRFTLPKKYYIEVFGNYLYNAFYSIYDLGPQAIINLSFKKSFLKDHLTFTLNANDPFNIKRIRINIGEQTFNRDLQNFLPIQKLSVGLSYNFFKGKKSTDREYIESTSQDAINRLSK